MKEIFRANVASRLRELRANKQFTLIELSNITGISKDILSRYENNKVSIQVDVLAQILTAYNINLANFFEEILAKTQNK